MNCPICKSELKNDSYHDDVTLLEYDYECTVCGRYQEHYAYGDTEAGVKLDTGWLVWQWGHNASVQERGCINMEMEMAFKTARMEREREK